MLFQNSEYLYNTIDSSQMTHFVHLSPLLAKMIYYVQLMIFTMFQYGIVHWLFGIHVICKNKPDQIDDSFIFAANHTSHLDTVAILLSLPHSIRHRLAVAAAKDHFFTKRRYAWARWLFGLIPVDRKGGLIALCKTVSTAVASNRGVLLFPEGSRSRNGQIQKFKAGVGYVSAKLDLQVIPVYVEGSYQLMKYNRFFPCRGTVTVQFGQPMKNDGKDPEAFTNQIENAVRLLQNTHSD